VAHDARLVDQERPAERDTARGFDVIGAADLVLHVGDHRVLHLTDAAVVDRRVFPCQVGEWLSIETLSTSTPRFLNSSSRWSNAISSDGQTKVKSSG